MSIFKKSISPFDQYDNKKAAENRKVVTNIDAKYLSARASIFMVGLILSLCAIVVRSSNPICMLCCIAAVVCVSGLTMSLFKKLMYRPFVLFLNILLATASVTAARFIGIDVALGEYIYLMPLVAGMTALGCEAKDGSKVYRRVNITNEILIPLLAAMVSTALAFAVAMFVDRNTVSLMIILAAISLGAFSFIITKATGTGFYFTTPLLSDYSDIPVASSENLRTFVLDRVKFSISVLVSFVTATVVVYLTDMYLIDKSDLTLILVPLSAAIVYMIFGLAYYGKRPKTSSKILFSYESCAANALVVLPYMVEYNWGEDFVRAVVVMVLYVFTIIIADFLVVGYFVVYKRRMVFSDTARYVEGVPLIMILAGVAIMCVEAIALM